MPVVISTNIRATLHHVCFHCLLVLTCRGLDKSNRWHTFQSLGGGEILTGGGEILTGGGEILTSGGEILMGG